MQNQSSFEEETTGSQYLSARGAALRGEVRIEGVATVGIKYLRRWVLASMCALYTVVLLLWALTGRHVSTSFLVTIAVAVGFMALTLWLQTSLMAKYWPKKHRPSLTLSPESLAIDGPVTGATRIPWSDIGKIRGVSFLGLPLVVIEDPQGWIRRRLGSRYWMYWWPGGIGLNALTFGHTGEALAQKIGEYRDGAI